MARALVTGATGFVGGRLVSRLLDGGWEVAVLARAPARAEGLAARGVAVHPGDLTDAAAVSAAVEAAAPDVVFHLAAWYEIGIRDAARMEAVNVGGTRNVLAAVAGSGARMVHCSTVGAYGACEGEVRDEGWYHPASVAGLHYTRTKRAAHEAVLEAAAGGVDAVVISPVSIYGPGDPSIIGTLLRYLVRGLLPVGFFRDTRLGFVHVDDVAAALVLAHERGRAGRDYIVTDRTLCLQEVLTMAARAAGRRPPIAWLPPWVVRLSWPISPLLAPLFGQGPWILREALAMMDGVDLDYDGLRARRELGWEPGDFGEQMNATVRWFVENR